MQISKVTCLQWRIRISIHLLQPTTKNMCSLPVLCLPAGHLDVDRWISIQLQTLGSFWTRRHPRVSRELPGDQRGLWVFLHHPAYCWSIIWSLTCACWWTLHRLLLGRWNLWRTKSLRLLHERCSLTLTVTSDLSDSDGDGVWTLVLGDDENQCVLFI